VETHCGFTANIAENSDQWQELAYTVLSTVNMEQIQWGYGTFGPRWTSTLNSSRRPVLLTRKFGEGEILFSQVGGCNVLPAPGLATGKTEQAPLYLRVLTENVIRWARGTAADGKQSVEK
jgi:hypothetical protein